VSSTKAIITFFALIIAFSSSIKESQARSYSLEENAKLSQKKNSARTQIRMTEVWDSDIMEDDTTISLG
jgi:hypothetical protein